MIMMVMVQHILLLHLSVLLGMASFGSGKIYCYYVKITNSNHLSP